MRFVLPIALAALLYNCDFLPLAIAAQVALIVLLVAAGFAIARWRALWLAFAVLPGTIAADVFLIVEWAPFDHEDAYEPLPITPFAILALPIFAVLIALGVRAGKLRRRGRAVR